MVKNNKMKKHLFIIGLLTLTAVIIGGILIIENFYPTQSLSPNQIRPEKIINIESQTLKPVPKWQKPESEVTLIAVGDIMLSRSVEQLMVKQNDFTLPFSSLASLTKNADITFGNLETAILPGRQINTGEFMFRTSPKSVTGLNLGGFDVVSLANNHTPNFGLDGLKSTFSNLDKAGIKFVGAGIDSQAASQPVITEKQGIKFGFLAYVYQQPANYQAAANHPGVNFMDLAKLKTDVKILKPQVDFVIVSMHAGTEYVPEPNQEQIDFAHAAIEAGASLVIGSHPHVVQTVQKYKDGYIFYSLGNFIFDQLWSDDTQQGLMAKVSFSPKQIDDIEFIPVQINKNFAPQLASATTTQKIINRLKTPLKIQTKFYWTGSEYAQRPSYQINNEQSSLPPTTYQEKYLTDGKLLQAVIIKNKAYVMLDGKAIWESNSGYKVENVLIGDFNNDGIDEIGFSLYKQGSFGPNLPFWLKENDKNISNHLFLYQLKGEASLPRLQMVWGSSALDQPIIKMALVDLDQDGKNELAVLEKDDNSTADLGIWRFNEFNFVNLYKSEAGNYFDLKTDLNYIYLKAIN